MRLTLTDLDALERERERVRGIGATPAGVAATARAAMHRGLEGGAAGQDGGTRPKALLEAAATLEEVLSEVGLEGDEVALRSMLGTLVRMWRG